MRGFYCTKVLEEYLHLKKHFNCASTLQNIFVNYESNFRRASIFQIVVFSGLLHYEISISTYFIYQHLYFEIFKGAPGIFFVTRKCLKEILEGSLVLELCRFLEEKANEVKQHFFLEKRRKVC